MFGDEVPNARAAARSRRSSRVAYVAFFAGDVALGAWMLAAECGRSRGRFGGAVVSQPCPSSFRVRWRLCSSVVAARVARDLPSPRLRSTPRASRRRPLRGHVHRPPDRVLPEAIRLLVFKADGSVLVHADSRRLQAAQLDDPADRRSSTATSAIVVRKRAGRERGPARDPPRRGARGVRARAGRGRRPREGRCRAAPAGGARRAARTRSRTASASSGASGRPRSARST